MITAYALEQGQLIARRLAPGEALPPDALWLDLLEPSVEEARWVNQALGVDAPTREEMQEIELSSRIYREDEASYMTATVLFNAETPQPQTTAVTFIRTNRAMVTLRYVEPQSFRQFIARATRQPSQYATSADTMLLSLLDSIVDRAADILENVTTDLDKLSRSIFAHHHGDLEDVAREEGDLENIVRGLGRVEDLTSRVRDSLLSLGRIATFLGQDMIERKTSKDNRQRVKTLARDIASLTEHAAFLAHKGNFLLDASLGLINLQQNRIIKIFTVAATIFLPPTLIASIYGMNFEAMPELDWAWGYPFALGLMILSAVLPIWYFKRRGWL